MSRQFWISFSCSSALDTVSGIALITLMTMRLQSTLSPNAEAAHSPQPLSLRGM